MSIAKLLREFLESDGIQNYSNILCWGCGRDKRDGAHDPMCLVQRAQEALALTGANALATVEAERERCAKIADAAEATNEWVSVPRAAGYDRAAKDIAARIRSGK